MRLNNPIECLASCVYTSLDHFSKISYESADYSAMDSGKVKSIRDCPRIIKQRKACADDLEVIAMFAQIWGSTALGFEGVGGQAITQAYTCVVLCKPSSEYAVYFGGQFAYIVTDREKLACFLYDVKEQKIEGVKQARTKYQAKTSQT